MPEVEIGKGAHRPARLRLRRDRDRAERGAPATPRTSRSPGRSTPTASSCRCIASPDGQRRVAAHRRARSAGSAASASSTSRACGPATTTPTRSWPRSPALDDGGRRPGGCRSSTPRPVREELIAERVAEIRASGVVTAASLTPQRPQRYYKTVLDAGRRHPRHPRHGRLRRARRDARRADQPQDVHRRARRAGHRRRLRQLPDRAAPHAHGRGRACSSGRRHRPRRDHRRRRADGDLDRRRGGGPARLPRRVRRALRPRHRRRRHAHGGRRRQGDRLRRRRRDARLAAGPHDDVARPRPPLGHGELPPRAAARHPRARSGTVGTLEEVLVGPATTADGTTNLFGGLRRAMASSGYSNLKEFQKVELMVTAQI